MLLSQLPVSSFDNNILYSYYAKPSLLLSIILKLLSQFLFAYCTYLIYIFIQKNIHSRYHYYALIFNHFVNELKYFNGTLHWKCQWFPYFWLVCLRQKCEYHRCYTARMCCFFSSLVCTVSFFYAAWNRLCNAKWLVCSQFRMYSRIKCRFLIIRFPMAQ